MLCIPQLFEKSLLWVVVGISSALPSKCLAAAEHKAAATQPQLSDRASVSDFVSWLASVPPMPDSQTPRVWRKNGEVRAIDLSSIPVTEQDLELSSRINTLQEFLASDNKLTYDLRPLARLTKLRDVVLMRCELKPDFFSWVTSDMPLESLKLNWSRGVNGTLSPLSRLKHLNVLNLSNTDITNEDIRDLAECTSLSYLSLQAANINDSSVEDIARIASLRVLYLGNSDSISNGGIARLKKLQPDLVLRN